MARPEHRILGATIFIALGTFAIRLLGLAKESVTAQAFGTGDAVEAYIAAGSILVYAIAVLSTFLPSALVPALAEVRASRGAQAARDLMADLMGWSIAALLAVSAALLLAWPWLLDLVAGSFPPAKQELTTRLFYVLLPSFLLNGIVSLWNAVLNSEKRFALTVFTPGIVPLSIALCVYLWAPHWGAWALAGGHTAGCVLEFSVVAIGAKRCGLSLWPHVPRRSAEIDGVLRQYAPLIGGGLLMRGTVVVDQAMAARLPAGNLASLKYASNLVGAVLSIFATALGTASLPYLSDMAARKDWRAMRASLRHYSWLVLWASVPIALGGWWLSESVIRLVYERGEFRAQDSATVGECFAMYALQIPFYTLGMLASRVLSALKHNALLLRVAALNLALNIVFNLWFLRLFGIAGIALSTAAVYAVSTAILLVLALRKLRLQETLG